MLRQIFAAIVAALAALPRFVVTVCRQTGKLLLSLVPGSAPMTTSAGLEADDALQELRQAREEAQATTYTPALQVCQYAAAVISGSQPPDISTLDQGFQRWLEDLDVSACKRLLKCKENVIERHLFPKCAADHIAGVPSIEPRPSKALPVMNGSKKGNLAGEAFVDEFWANLISELPDEPARA